MVMMMTDSRFSKVAPVSAIDAIVGERLQSLPCHRLAWHDRTYERMQECRRGSGGCDEP
jgi:hypothetical protein